MSLVAKRVVADYLERHGYTQTLEAFNREASAEGLAREERVAFTVESLIEAHESIAASAQRARQLAVQHRTEQTSPLDLSLSGPSTIPFHVRQVFDSLHPSNILHLSLVRLPLRSFSTTDARYVRRIRNVLCSTGADKNIVLSDACSGEMIELIEGGNRTGDMRHSGAVLCTAQNPKFVREFVSGGMDGKVIVHDLLHGKAIQVLNDHTKFVVRCAFSPCGRYLATCSYDRSIKIFERQGSEDRSGFARMADGIEEEDSETDAPALLDTQYELVHTVKVVNNPESVLFVRGPHAPHPNDPGAGDLRTSEGTAQAEPISELYKDERTWLVFTCRSDCFVHYLALPKDDGKDRIDDEAESIARGIQATSIADSESRTNVPAWTELAFNTNVSRSDVHVSYSLLHITLHPLGHHLAIQTGDHAIPASGHAPPSSSLSRILLMPLLSSARTTTIWTDIASSGFAINRHAWLHDGSAAWCTSEDGVLRLIDVHGKTRAKVQAHGAAAAVAAPASSPATWTRGGNTVIKDVVVLDPQGTAASCGFDHTVRITKCQ